MSSTEHPFIDRMWWALCGPDASPCCAVQKALLSSKITGAPALNLYSYFLHLCEAEVAVCLFIGIK